MSGPHLVTKDGAGGPRDPWWYSLGSHEWLTEQYVATRFVTRQQAVAIIRARELSGAQAVEANNEDGV